MTKIYMADCTHWSTRGRKPFLCGSCQSPSLRLCLLSLPAVGEIKSHQEHGPRAHPDQ